MRKNETPKTPEELAELERLKTEAVTALKAAMARLPFDIHTADATRILAFKAAVRRAQSMILRDPPEAFKYDEARRQIENCGCASLTDLAPTFLKPQKETGIHVPA